MLCAASLCSWAAPKTTTFGSGSTWTVDYSTDVDLYIDIKDQNGEIRDSLTLSAENDWTFVWEAVDCGSSTFTAEELAEIDAILK